MRLRKIGIDKFATYRDQEVEFPAEGLVVIIGPNGAGKSALGVEALPWTLWGESVRGDKPVPDGAVWAEVDVPGEARLYVRRIREGRKTTMLTMFRASEDELYRTNANGDESGQTATETQARIDRTFGDWRRFSSTRVFSRELLAKFSGATDKARKELLEGVLGLEQFETAYRLALKEAGAAEKVVVEAQTVLRLRQEAQGRADHALAAAEAEAGEKATAADVAGLEKRIAVAMKLRDVREAEAAKLRQMAKLAGAGVAAADARRTAKRGELGRETQALSAARARMLAGVQLKDCPTCLRVVDAKAHETITLSLGSVVAAHEARCRELDGQLRALQADLEDQEATANALDAQEAEADRKVVDLDDALEEVNADLTRALAAKGSIDRAKADVARCAEDASVALQKLSGAQGTLRVAELAAQALGPRGARVRLFGDALARLEDGANAALARRFSMRLAIAGQATQASGKVVDDVSIALVDVADPENPPGGGRYSGASTGQRVRVDVALLLGLAVVAGDEGLIAFDEVFDGLDEEGLEWITEVLVEMARTRQVIITTHNERFLALLPAGVVWRASLEGGVSKLDVSGQ